jgi:probable phosphoglycerate mutase
MTDRFNRRFALAKDATEIILARHGTVTFRTHGRADAGGPVDLAGGEEDPPLTADGRAEAKALANRLRLERLDVLAVSPLLRAQETAAAVALVSGLKSVTLAELREVGLGEWEGRLSARIAEGGPVVTELFRRQRWDVIPGAEPAPRFAARVRVALAHLVSLAEPGHRAVAVAHGGVIAEACRQVTGSHRFAFLGAENGSITRLVHNGDGSWTLRSFNDIAHLEALA